MLPSRPWRFPKRRQWWLPADPAGSADLPQQDSASDQSTVGCRLVRLFRLHIPFVVQFLMNERAQPLCLSSTPLLCRVRRRLKPCAHLALSHTGFVLAVAALVVVVATELEVLPSTCSIFGTSSLTACNAPTAAAALRSAAARSWPPRPPLFSSDYHCFGFSAAAAAAAAAAVSRRFAE